MRFAEAARQPDGGMEMATLSMRLLLCAGLCFVLSACGTSGSNPQSVGSVGSSRAGCAGEIAAAPPAPAVTSKAITNHLAPDGSWQIRAPENLQPKPVDSNRDGYVLQLQEGSGLYPMLAVRVLRSGWDEYVVELTTTVERYLQDASMAEAAAKSFAFTK